jgi:hypothetical protein
MFYIFVCMWSFLFLFMWLSFGSIFHVWGKTCSLCLSEPGLLHLTWCPSIASIYLQTTCQNSYGWVKLHCVHVTHFLDPFTILVVFITWLLWIVMQWTSVYRCLYCILTYILLGRCSGAISLDHMVVLSLVFWGISILLSIVVVLICIPTNSV